MKNTYQLWWLLPALAMLAFSCQTQKKEETTMPTPPVAKKIEKKLTAHGHTRTDSYYWLNQRDNAEVIDYLNAENAYTEAVMKHTEGLQNNLFEEITSRIKQNDKSVPYFKNGYYYYTRYVEGGEYPIYCRKKESLEAEEEVLIDGNKMAEGHSYFQVGGLAISPNNLWMAYGIDTVSRRQYNIYFKNLETLEVLDYHIDNTTGGASWANDNQTIFYTRKDEQTLREDKIWKHKVGESTTNDVNVFFEEDETFYTFVYKSKSGKYIIIGSESTTTTEYRFLNANTPDAEFTVFQPRERGLEYQIGHFQDKFYVRTNLDATNFRLMATPETKTTKENWTEVIPSRENVLLENFELFKHFLVVEERQNALTHLRIINTQTNDEHYIDFGEEVYMAYVGQNPEFDTETLRFGYSSMTTPNSIFDYNMATKQKQLKKQDEVLEKGFSPDNYVTKRVWATANDGTKIPMSVVYKKGIERNGTNPLLLYAYGSYGHTIDPYFSYGRLSLLNRGFVFAIAHIRGGQAMGRQWYEDGKMLKKMNTFTDYIACAEEMVSQKYTSPDKMFAMGGSAGGLLMGVVYNLRPDLFKGVVAAVPFVDVVTTMLDESIPLTTGEYDEWGNPNEKQYYDYMLSYSPYDQVKAQNYTNLLVTTGLHDSQVQYWEPAKWVAKLREMKTDNNVILLKTNMEAGHGGASGRFEAYKEVALEYAFMLDLVGIDK